jgi:hypothetical protein
MVAHSNVKGVTSSKIFEYISLQKPFIVCPNDHDVLEEIALQSGLGKVIDSPNEVAQYLNKIILNYQIEPDLEKLSQFDNMRQVESLSDILLGSDTNIITL